MIVQYTIKSEETSYDAGFVLGGKYIVLVTIFDLNANVVKLSVLTDDDRYPVLVNAKYFTVVDKEIPENYSLFDFEQEYYCIQPSEFGGDFWDDFHDGNAEAEEKFRTVLKRLYEFHGWEFDASLFQYS